MLECLNLASKIRNHSVCQNTLQCIMHLSKTSPSCWIDHAFFTWTNHDRRHFWYVFASCLFVQIVKGHMHMIACLHDSKEDFADQLINLTWQCKRSFYVSVCEPKLSATKENRENNFHHKISWMSAAYARVLAAIEAGLPRKLLPLWHHPAGEFKYLWVLLGLKINPFCRPNNISHNQAICMSQT